MTTPPEDRVLVIRGHPMISELVVPDLRLLHPPRADTCDRGARRGRHGKAKVFLMRLWLELDGQIEAAVAADQGLKQ